MGDRNAYTNATPVVSPGHARKMTAIGGAIPLLTTDLTLNRTTGLFVAPAGFTVVGHAGYVTDLDTNGTPLLSIVIGDATDNDRFLTASTAGRTGGDVGALALVTGLNFRFTADTEIVLTATAAAATAAAGTLTYFLFGYFD
jgi:hypothetical protein